MKRDQKLVSAFLDEYKKISGSSFEVKEWLDDLERTKPAVEALAVEKTTGETLAIEHTLLQPFVGEKDDTQRFLSVVGDLERDDSLRLAHYMVTVSLRVGAIPKGVVWSDVNKTLGQWIHDDLPKLPDGPSVYEIFHEGLKIEIGVSKTTLEHHDKGMLLFERYVPPASLVDVMRASFKKKLPKLVGTKANKRILLFEQDGCLLGNGEIHESIKTLSAEFAELKQVDEIWLLWTMVWESEGYLSFTRIWPDIKTWVNGNLQ
jgi:hypothetical protein